MTKENKVEKNIDENETSDEPIIDAQTMLIISYWSGVGLIVFLWCLGLYFFTKWTLFFTFIGLAVYVAQWFDKKTLYEAGVDLSRKH